MDVKFYRRRKGERVSGFIVQARNHRTTLLVFILIITGLTAGALMIKFNDPVTEIIVSYFKNFSGLVVTRSFFENFLSLFFVNELFVVISYVFGLCAIGAPIVCSLPLIKGIGIGAVSAYFYKAYALTGFGYCMLIFFPPQIIYLFSMIISANESFTMSKEIYYNTLKISRNSSQSVSVKMYNLRMILSFIITLFGALSGSLLNTYLSGIFEF